MLRQRTLLVALLAFAGTTGVASVTLTQTECALELLNRYRAGANVKKADAAGFHGTSIEAMALAKETGALAGGILPENQHGFYFFPNLAHPRVKEAFKNKAVRHGENVVPGDDKDPVRDAWEGAVGYANRIAVEHRLLALLQLPFTADNQKAVAEYIANPNDRENIDSLIGTKGDRAKLRAAYAAARKAKGVVVFVAPRVFDDMTVTNAAPDDDGLRIDTRATNGFPIDRMLAIDPLDDAEYDWFTALRRELSK